MEKKSQRIISEKKLKIISELENLLKNKRTIFIASIKNIPLSQYQEIVKKFRADAIVKVLKKKTIFRAIDSLKNEQLKNLKNSIGENCAILFSDIETFELAEKLTSKKTPAKAKAGQEAPIDIEVPAGPTDLVPGPAISDLGALGIQIQIEKGKIHIKESKIIVKKGEKIRLNVADMMGKLDIKPFMIGFSPVASFDMKEGKIYVNIKINKKETLEQIKSSFGKALGFAVKINYFSQETIKMIIGKAGLQGNAIEKVLEQNKNTQENN